MAYQARDRDPLFDSSMQAMIEKRGKELFGLILVGLAGLMTAMIVSYSPEDPSFMAVTDVPVQNFLGHIGASIAAPIFMIIGWSSWVFALVLGVWGVRFICHAGSDRGLGRIVFLPVVLALSSMYASTLVPWGGWTHSYGLGGLFGDTVVGLLLNSLPIDLAWSVKILSVLLALVIVGALSFLLGFSLSELRACGRFLLVGIILSYDRLMQLLGRGTVGTLRFGYSWDLTLCSTGPTKAKVGPNPCRPTPCRPTPCRPKPCRPKPFRPKSCDGSGHRGRAVAKWFRCLRSI